MRGVSAVVGLVCLGASLYFGFSGSWPTAVLFVLLFGGAEFTAYAMGVDPIPEAKDKYAKARDDAN